MAAGRDQTFEEEFLSCAICKQIYTDPCSLRCQHSFCRKCVTSYIRTRPDAVQSKTIPCAMCRQDTPVPNPTRPVEEWAKQLRPSLMLQGLMDRRQLDHRYQEGRDVCFLCKEIGEIIPAVSWCSDCAVTLCSRCVKLHLKGPATKKHDIYNLSQGARVKERRKVKCRKHEEELIRVICKDCNKAICQTCCIQKHTKHNVASIEAMIPEIRSALTEKKQIIKMKIEDNFTNFKTEESKIQQLEDTKTNSRSKIMSSVNSAINLVREKEILLLQKLDDASDRGVAEHQAKVKLGQITNQMYQQHCEFIDQALQSESEVDMYDKYQVCLSGAVESVMKTESDTRNTSVVEEVKFTPNIKPLKKAMTEMSEIDVTFLTGKTQQTGKSTRSRVSRTYDTSDDENDPIDVTFLTLR